MFFLFDPACGTGGFLTCALSHTLYEFPGGACPIMNSDNSPSGISSSAGRRQNVSHRGLEAEGLPLDPIAGELGKAKTASERYL
jgi:hypothetical protein